MNIFKRLFRKKSGKELWAEKEIELAVKREQEADREDCEKRGKKYSKKDFSYGGEIYKSAYRAYKSLLKDGHSGMSWAFTKSVLMRLMESKPLTPLTGDESEWILVDDYDGKKLYQNNRCSAVFKEVLEDGTFHYFDNDRVQCVDAEDGSIHHFKLSSDEAEKMFPISMPYLPGKRGYKVHDCIFSSEGKIGEFDTVGILRVEEPDGTEHLVNKFYKEDANGSFVQITKAEYDLRYECWKSHKNDK